MTTTAGTLRRTAHLINHRGLHTGEQFIDRATNTADIAAAVYVACEGNVPPEFYTDEVTSLEIIAASAPTMQALRVLSDSLDTDPCVTQIAPGYDVPDYIEHVCNWAATTPVWGTRPPTASEVIGTILRAANTADARERRFGTTDAYGICLTCGGHGAITTATQEIPVEELSPRRQQGHAAGHRFHRSITAPCPNCDGQDRVTAIAEQAIESAAA